MTGSQLQQFREAMGLSQEQLGELLCATADQIEQWEVAIYTPVLDEFTEVFNLAMKWVEFKRTSPGHAERFESFSEAEAILRKKRHGWKRSKE
jgi:transcriptional regulator with XRE-family HTH domain